MLAPGGVGAAGDPSCLPQATTISADIATAIAIDGWRTTVLMSDLWLLARKAKPMPRRSPYFKRPKNQSYLLCLLDLAGVRRVGSAIVKRRWPCRHVIPARPILTNGYKPARVRPVVNPQLRRNNRRSSRSDIAIMVRQRLLNSSKYRFAATGRRASSPAAGRSLR
jgi:hypothetical protein